MFQKSEPLLFFNNLVKNELILIIFDTKNSEQIDIDVY